MNEQKKQNSSVSIYSSIENFENGQRIAKALSSAELVPASYKNNIPNTMIALEIANRIGISPFMVMQNLDVIKGKPSWSSTFIIAALNTCGRFKPLRFRFEGADSMSDMYGCRAIAVDVETGEALEGPLVNWKMVKDEGWLDKPGSKWKTMPELMFQYRAASFFGRLYAPDILKGMHSVEEIMDSQKSDIKNIQLEEIKLLLDEKRNLIPEEDIMNIERIIDEKEELSYNKVLTYLKALK